MDMACVVLEQKEVSSTYIMYIVYVNNFVIYILAKAGRREATRTRWMLFGFWSSYIQVMPVN